MIERHLPRSHLSRWAKEKLVQLCDEHIRTCDAAVEDGAISPEELRALKIERNRLARYFKSRRDVLVVK